MPKMGPGRRGGSSGERTVPASDYVIALTWFKRQVGKDSGQDYLRCKFEVCGGRLKKRSFFANMSCNISKEGTAMRWQVLMEVCGVTEEWEIGSTREGNAREGDENIRRLFMNKPFKARVKAERSGQYTNNDLDMILFPKSWTQEDRDIAQTWLDDQGSRGGGAPEGDAADPPDAEDPDPDYVPEAGGGGFAEEDDDFDPARF